MSRDSTRRSVLRAGGALVVGSAFLGTATAATQTVSDGDDLQAAVDAAADGDTLEVEAGTYDSIDVSKNLTFVGLDGPSQTAIEGGSDNAILLTGHTDELPGISIEGFTLRSSGGAGLIAFSDGNTDFDTEDLSLSNLVVDGSMFGIYLFDATGVEVTDCTVRGVDGAAVSMAGATDVRVAHNTIQDNGTGVALGVGNPESVYPDNGDVQVTNNDIVGNDLGVFNGDDETTIDATDNWWGHASGPGGPDGRVNPAGKAVGKGDGIEGDVAFDPWLRRSIDHPSR